MHLAVCAVAPVLGLGSRLVLHHVVEHEAQSASDPETNSVTLGVRFSSTVPGTVSAIRFYQSSSNRGPHTGALWSATGKLWPM